jgi:uncharacterized protein (TIGR02246 family)
MDKREILALFEHWNNAIKTKVPKRVIELYAHNAVLLPTISNNVCHSHEEMEKYFTDFLTREPVGELDETNISIFNDIAMNSGLYTFSFKDGSKVQARFTFVYQWSGKSWKIIKHHSSQMPESTFI